MAGALRLQGQFVTGAIAGDYGKQRPALIVQSNLFAELPSTLFCPLTTTIRLDADLFRVGVEPSTESGLRSPFQIAVDKMTVVPASKIGEVIGKADDALMLRLITLSRPILGMV